MKLLMLVYCIPDGNTFVIKDGLLFSHLESLYERGLNSLAMIWRDEQISIYCPKEDSQGMVDAVLRLNDNYQFETLEEDTLDISMHAKNHDSLVEYEPGHIYNVKIKIDLNQISQVSSTELQQHSDTLL